VLLDVPANLAPAVGGLVTFAIYASDRLVDVDADAVAYPERTAFVRRHEEPLRVLAAAAYGVAVMLSVLGGPLPLALTLLPGVVWILYATDWLPSVLAHLRRLKDVFLLNSAVVAVAWAVSATFLPMEFAGVAYTTSAAIVVAYFFLRSFANTEVPNVRDVDADRAAGVATLPVVLGVDGTRRVLYGIDLLTVALVGSAALLGHLPALPTVALLVGVAYSLGVTTFVGRDDDGELLALAAEFEYVVVGLALVPIVYGL
jgi:4-hydroxybenzoate polyprenyltransferase